MTVSEIAEIVRKGLFEEYNVYGLRADRDKIMPGERLKKSHQWYQDDPSAWGEDCPYDEDMHMWDGGELDGTCAAGIPDYACDLEKEIGLALERARTYTGCVYLIGGSGADRGNDIGEMIIADAVCIARV